ncbi:MAG: copper homeostasis protein CutC [Vicinamibacterales bacterium]
MLLEVIAETVADACEAEQGGAGRIELVRDLGRGGLTPPQSLIEAVVQAVNIPVRIMLRDSEPFELADNDEPARLHIAARAALASGASGLVLGFLHDGIPDFDSMSRILGDLVVPVTFHRAFDGILHPLRGMQMLAREPRIDRVLTSGGAGEWEVRLARLKKLRAAAPSHPGILPCGGIDAAALRDLAGASFAEAHVGRAARVATGRGYRVCRRRVAALLADAMLAAGPS